MMVKRKNRYENIGCDYSHQVKELKFNFVFMLCIIIKISKKSTHEEFPTERRAYTLVFTNYRVNKV